MRRSRIFFLPGGWEWSEEYLGLLGEGEGIRMYYDFFKGPYIPPPSLIDPLIVSQRETETETEMNA